MPMTYADIENLIATQAAETPSLEFKDGASLSRGGNRESELVKDVTAMANAAGGRIVYGIAEGRSPSGESIATAIAPVTDIATTSDWIHQLIAANTSPPLADFNVVSISCPTPNETQRIVVIDVNMAATAHQSTRSHIYYQRIGASARPMLDFQVRDVMARRTRPRIKVIVTSAVLLARTDFQDVRVSASLLNEGNLSIDRWQLRLGVPSLVTNHQAIGEQANAPPVAQDRAERFRGYTCFDYSSNMAHIQQHRMNDIHPGNLVELDARIGLGVLRLAITSQNYWELAANRPPIRWTLFMADTPPQEGEIPFQEWCNF